MKAVWSDLPPLQRIIVVGMLILGLLTIVGTVINTMANARQDRQDELLVLRQDQRDAAVLDCMVRIQTDLTGGLPEVRKAGRAKDAAERRQDDAQTELLIAQATGQVGAAILLELREARHAYQVATDHYLAVQNAHPIPASPAKACPRN